MQANNIARTGHVIRNLKAMMHTLDKGALLMTARELQPMSSGFDEVIKDEAARNRFIETNGH